jgi:hypothetical protein
MVIKRTDRGLCGVHDNRPTHSDTTARIAARDVGVNANL